MTSTYEDRTLLATDVAIKAPCRAATTANIVLNGLQTVDGVVLAAGDRVLVKNQTSGVNNGIYLASTGDWTRASDFQGNRAAVTGTFVSVTSGTVNGGTFYQCTAANPIIIGSSSLTFTQGTLGPVTLPLPIASGGTGSVTTLAARQALLLDAHGADIASAATVNLDNATGDLVDVTGTTTITAITLAEGVEKTVRFTGILTLTNGALLVLLGAANITTAAGDFAVFRGYAAGVVRCVEYSRASGSLGASAVWGSGIANFGTITKRKTADQSVTSSITLQDDSHLTFAIAANEEWVADIIISAGTVVGAAGGFKIAFTTPGGATSLAEATYIGASANLSLYNFSTSGGVILQDSPATPNVQIRAHIWVLNGATPGNVTLQFAQNVSNANALTFRKGSSLNAVRIT